MTCQSISVVIPVFNEALLLRAVLLKLMDNLEDICSTFEVVLSENGSNDGSAELAESIAAEYTAVRVLHSRTADYGYALKRGLSLATGEYVFHCAVDFVDLDFLRSALQLINNHDAVLGSKYTAQGGDERSRFRHFGGMFHSWAVRILFSLPFTDTHGIKLLKRESVLPYVAKCQLGGAVFDSELVLRLSDAGLRICEIPLKSAEIRPSRRSSLRVGARSAADLVRLALLRRKWS